MLIGSSILNVETREILANPFCIALCHFIRWCGLNLHYEMLGGYYSEVCVLCLMLSVLKDGVVMISL